MKACEVVAAWRGAAGSAMVVGPARALAEVEAHLNDAGMAPRRLSAELLARLSDAPALAAADAAAARSATGPAERLAAQAQRDAVREELAGAFGRLLAELADESAPVCLTDLELALGERLELARLAELAQPMLLLVPGRLRDGGAWLGATAHLPGVPLPPALTPADRAWEVDHDAA